MLGNGPSFSIGSFCSGSGSWARAGFATLITSSHPVGESGFILVAFGFPGAVATVMLEVFGDAVSPAVRDGFSSVIRALRSAAGAAVDVGSVILFGEHGLEKVLDVGDGDSCIGRFLDRFLWGEKSIDVGLG